MPISADLEKLVHAFGDAADDVGAVYADTIHSKNERDAATKRMVQARAALLQAIADAIAQERTAIAEQARNYAGHYQPHSDGRNTFIMLAEWIEARP